MTAEPHVHRDPILDPPKKKKKLSTGAIVGIAMKFSHQLREGGYVPFGPFLVGAGLLAMVLGPNTVLQTLLGTLGL